MSGDKDSEGSGQTRGENVLPILEGVLRTVTKVTFDMEDDRPQDTDPNGVTFGSPTSLVLSTVSLVVVPLTHSDTSDAPTRRVPVSVGDRESTFGLGRRRVTTSNRSRQQRFHSTCTRSFTWFIELLPSLFVKL